MIYHVPSWVGFMLWALHCGAKLRPWRSARWAIYHHLESPGTKAYSKREAEAMLDWKLYPRWLVRRTGNALGTNLFVEAVK